MAHTPGDHQQIQARRGQYCTVRQNPPIDCGVSPQPSGLPQGYQAREYSLRSGRWST